MITGAPAKVRRKNPYVGPRAFKADEPLYGRERECRELTDLLIAERIVLLHCRPVPARRRSSSPV